MCQRRRRRARHIWGWAGGRSRLPGMGSCSQRPCDLTPLAMSTANDRAPPVPPFLAPIGPMSRQWLVDGRNPRPATQSARLPHSTKARAPPSSCCGCSARKTTCRNLPRYLPMHLSDSIPNKLHDAATQRTTAGEESYSANQRQPEASSETPPPPGLVQPLLSATHLDKQPPSRISPAGQQETAQVSSPPHP